MTISEIKVRVEDIFRGYEDDGEDGIFAYNGKLTIRPPYQREFIYNLKEQEAVIHTILKGFPLNIMYWILTKGTVKKDNENHIMISDDAEFEVLDGQQRTLSVMKFLSHKLQIHWDGKAYYKDSLPDDLYSKLMNYEFMIYICEGTTSEKLDWFEIVNVAGEELTAQELRNSVYTGPWLSDAKLHFSKSSCAAKGLSEKYITGAPLRQELLEKALIGICELKGYKEIKEYMADHVSCEDADELWQYFQNVIHWVETIFPLYYPDMKGRNWCHLYNKYHTNSYNSNVMKNEVKRLHEDDEIQEYKGIYEYLLSKDEDPFAARLLNLRTFSEKDKTSAYSKQGGICAICKRPFSYAEMAGDHIKPWSKGGLTTPENCQMLCKECNSKKSDMY
ncbi:MAG: HNH endonuclease [Ruminococcus sp.]|nr:HNH endonuclease [Ruminococcus sp.]